MFVDGGGCLLALSNFLVCNSFQSSEFWCALLFLECQTIVVDDSQDLYLIGVRDAGVACIE